MKSLKLTFFSLLAFIAITPLFAQNILPPKVDTKGLEDMKHPKYACLWEISGKGLKKPSYLFGTFHVSDKRVTTLHPNAEAAFQSAEILYTEIAFDPASEMKAAQRMIRKDGKTISQDIGPERAAKVNAILADINPLLTLEAGLDQMQTWAVFVVLPLLEEQMKGGASLDASLVERATKAKKDTQALETLDQHFALFSKLTDKQTLLSIDMTIEYMEAAKKANRNLTEELKAIYLSKLPKEIGNYLAETMEMAPVGDNKKEVEALNKLVIQELLITRNIGMAKVITKSLEAKPDNIHFFTAGAAHYFGEKNICELLEKAGYKIAAKHKQ